MSVGFVVLAHRHLDRVAEFVTHLAKEGGLVSVHVDKSTPYAEVAKHIKPLEKQFNVILSERVVCEWGTFSIVKATQLASAELLDMYPNLDHVFLCSGSCLPNKPVRQLKRYLKIHQDVDFIESVPAKNSYWAKGGLNEERMTLFFPLSWQKHRRLFDKLVDWQRKLNIERKLPHNLVPHIGSQWWCLTGETLRAILESPDRAAYDRYFKRCWIPDESYFQTLAQLHSKNIISRPLTYVKFDFQGKPFTFYDDHYDILHKSESFMIRKVWAGSNKLYESFLDPDAKFVFAADEDQKAFDTLIDNANQRRTKGRKGHFFPGAFPANKILLPRLTARPYTVVSGFQELFEDFPAWIGKQTGAISHGNLFSRRRAKFAEGKSVFKGNLSNNARIRDRNPEGFLSNLIKNAPDCHQVFQFDLRDRQTIAKHILNDPNAHLVYIKGSWIAQLVRLQSSPRGYLSTAHRLEMLEQNFLNKLNKDTVFAKVTILNHNDLMEAPGRVLKSLIREISPEALQEVTEMPKITDLASLTDIACRLRNEGLRIDHRSSNVADVPEKRTDLSVKPYVVK